MKLKPTGLTSSSIRAQSSCQMRGGRRHKINASKGGSGSSGGGAADNERKVCFFTSTVIMLNLKVLC